MVDDKVINKKYYWEVDVLKSLAIFLIILCHQHFFIFTNDFLFNEFCVYISYFGLGLFFFLSGYTIYNNNIIQTLFDVKDFVWKRITRIFPLYWLALISFFILYIFENSDIFKNNLSGINLVFNIFGLQAFTKETYFAMWYIGVILVYYLLYIFISYICKNDRQFIILSVTIAVILIILCFPLRIVTMNMPLYFLVFISGVLSNKHNLFYVNLIKKIIPFAIILLIISTMLYISLYTIKYDENSSIILKISLFAQTFIYHNIMLITS
jgi:peptidoglycan/LPS O-acetylase OafA/YrhL